MEILGVPEEDEPTMLKLTQELFGAADPELSRTKDELLTDEQRVLALQETVGEFIAYFSEMTKDRRSHPRDDAASVIANGEVHGGPLGELEVMSYFIIVATAGHDTTSNTTASGLWALAENQDQFRKLKEDPSLIPNYLDESIRWATPVKHFMRTATADAEVAGQKIAKGDWMMLSYPSGNRDDDVFDDPFSFKIDRSPNKHVAFGYGAHVCLGQHLGKMEMRILWEELLPRLESVELNGEARLTQSNFVCGPKHVPIRYKMN